MIKILRRQPEFLNFSIYTLGVMKPASQMFRKLKRIFDSCNNSSFKVGHYFFRHQLTEEKQLTLFVDNTEKQFIYCLTFFTEQSPNDWDFPFVCRSKNCINLLKRRRRRLESANR